MSTKIFIGYTTRTVPEEQLSKLMPTFEGRKGTSDPDKIAAQIAEKKLKWTESVANKPYTGTFDEVSIVVPSMELAVSYKSKDRQPFGDKPAVSVQVRAFLLKHFKNVWDNSTNHKGQYDAIFVGFNIRTFLKMLGIECSLPSINKQLPVSMWYGNTEHRDIEEAVNPKEYKSEGWNTVIAARRQGLEGDDLQRYDALFEGWSGPGLNASTDTAIAVVLAAQLGFLND